MQRQTDLQQDSNNAGECIHSFIASCIKRSMQEGLPPKPFPIKQKVFLFNNDVDLSDNVKRGDKSKSHRINALDLCRHCPALKPTMPHLKLKAHSSFIGSKQQKKSYTIDSSRKPSSLDYLSYVDSIKKTAFEELKDRKDGMVFELQRDKRTLETQRRRRQLNINLMMILKNRRSSGAKSSRSYQDMLSVVLKR